MGEHAKPYEVGDLLNTKDLQQEWKCDRKTITNMISQGLPVEKFQGKNYFNLLDCQAWYRGERSSRSVKQSNTSIQITL